MYSRNCFESNFIITEAKVTLFLMALSPSVTKWAVNITMLCLNVKLIVYPQEATQVIQFKCKAISKKLNFEVVHLFLLVYLFVLKRPAKLFFSAATPSFFDLDKLPLTKNVFFSELELASKLS